MTPANHPIPAVFVALLRAGGVLIIAHCLMEAVNRSAAQFRPLPHTFGPLPVQRYFAAWHWESLGPYLLIGLFFLFFASHVGRLLYSHPTGNHNSNRLGPDELHGVAIRLLGVFCLILAVRTIAEWVLPGPLGVFRALDPGIAADTVRSVALLLGGFQFLRHADRIAGWLTGGDRFRSEASRRPRASD